LHKEFGTKVKEFGTKNLAQRIWHKEFGTKSFGYGETRRPPGRNVRRSLVFRRTTCIHNQRSIDLITVELLDYCGNHQGINYEEKLGIIHRI
jgi:hypothetical protein